jgi:hypothetical protein
MTSEVERKRSIDEVEDFEKSAQHSGRVDKELAQYVSDVRINITPERSAQLRKMIDKRVLVIMIFTYFLQAIDKGTLSFASIMGLTADTGLENPDGTVSQHVSSCTFASYHRWRLLTEVYSSLGLQRVSTSPSSSSSTRRIGSSPASP